MHKNNSNDTRAFLEALGGTFYIVRTGTKVNGQFIYVSDTYEVDLEDLNIPDSMTDLDPSEMMGLAIELSPIAEETEIFTDIGVAIHVRDDLKHMIETHADLREQTGGADFIIERVTMNFEVDVLSEAEEIIEGTQGKVDVMRFSDRWEGKDE